MGIKLIAVDMDGTFLDDHKNYNRERFADQYQQMKEQGIRFVVASGNQYFQLISFFPEIAQELSFVADNGAWVVSEGESFFNAQLQHADFLAVADHLLGQSQWQIIACGKKSAYVLQHSDDSFKQMAARFYHRLALVESFTNIDDCMFKFALSLQPGSLLDKSMHSLAHELKGIMVPVSSGHGAIDLIIPGAHKAHGLSILQKKWGIKDSEVVCFGDGGNDIEMLRQAGFSFAMSNAPEKIKQVARFQAESCNEQGVLNVIDKILKKEQPFY